jgi:hypothetical protein
MGQRNGRSRERKSICKLILTCEDLFEHLSQNATRSSLTLPRQVDKTLVDLVTLYRFQWDEILLSLLVTTPLKR